jgi:hypothetical protein
MTETKVSAIEVLQAGPFSLREVAIKEFAEFFDSILEQNALSAEQQTALGESIKTSIERRDQVGAFLARIDAEADALKKEEARLATRRRSFERIREIFEDSLHAQLANWGVTRVEGHKYSFIVKKNPPKVNITDENQIPSEFITYTPTISKASIKDALQEGKEVPGCELVQGTRLEIK